MFNTPDISLGFSKGEIQSEAVTGVDPRFITLSRTLELRPDRVSFETFAFQKSV